MTSHSKRGTILALVTAAISGWTASAHATLVVYEPFDYAVTSSTSPARGLSGTTGTIVDSQVNGGGAGGYVAPNGQTWTPRAVTAGSTYDAANDAIVVADDLTVAGLHKPGSSGAARFGGLGHSPLLPLGQAFTPSESGTSVYFSLAFRIDDLTNLTAAGGIVAGLTNVIPTGSLGNPSVAAGALFVRPDPGDATRFQVGVGKTETSAAGATFDVSQSYATGTTQFVVARYTLFSGETGPSAGTNDVATMWINPSPGSFGGADPANGTILIDSTTNDPPFANNQIQGVFLRQSGALNGQNVADVIVADELRVGTTYASVTPVPEPVSLASLALIGAGLLARRRRTV